MEEFKHLADDMVVDPGGMEKSRQELRNHYEGKEGTDGQFES